MRHQILNFLFFSYFYIVQVYKYAYLQLNSHISDKLTINGIEVENNKTFEDGTSVFVISDFLFDHQTAVRSAFDALLRESPKHPGLTPILV